MTTGVFDSATYRLAQKLVGACGLVEDQPGVFELEDGSTQLEWYRDASLTSIEITRDLRFELFELSLIDRTHSHIETKDFSRAVAFAESHLRRV